MATTSSRPKSVIVILRRIYLNIVEGNHCAAKLIEYFKHWREWKIKNHRTDWVYMPLKRIHEDLMGEHSLHVIRAAIALLEKLGLIKKRRNLNEQDKTWQYRLNLDALASLLKKEQGTLRNEPLEFTVEQDTQDQYTNIKATTNVGDEEKIDCIEEIEEEELTPEASAVSLSQTVNEIQPITQITESSSTPRTTNPHPTESELHEVERQLRELRVNAAECKGVIRKYWANVQGAITLLKNFKGARNPIAVFINACKEGTAPESNLRPRSAIPDECRPPSVEQAAALDAAKNRALIRDYFFSTVDGVTKVVLTGGRQLPWWEFLEDSASAN